MVPIISPSPRQQAEFFGQLGTLLDAGLPLAQALSLAIDRRTPAQRRYWLAVIARLDQGMGFAMALSVPGIPLPFRRWYRTLLETAYQSGALSVLCHQLAQRSWADHQRDRYRHSILQSLLGFVTGTIVGLGALGGLSWLGIAILTGLTLGLGAIVGLSPPCHALRQRLPIVGRYQEIQFALQITELALPLQCGLSILAALDLLQHHLPASPLKQTLTLAASRIQQGQTLTQALGNRVPPLLRQSVQTGEIAGSLDTLLLKVAEFYDQELETLLRRTQGILKPLSLLGLGAIVLVLGIGSLQSLLPQLPN